MLNKGRWDVQVTPEQSLALVEYIAHLSVEDWDGIARDLRKLGFVPAGLSHATAWLPSLLSAQALLQLAAPVSRVSAHCMPSSDADNIMSSLMQAQPNLWIVHHASVHDVM